MYNYDDKVSFIVGSSSHKYVYGYYRNARCNFLKSLEDIYPVVFDCDKPIAIYLDNFSLPMIDCNKKDIDKNLLCTLSSEYLYFSIVYSIMNKIVEIDGFNILEDRVKKILNYFNFMCLNEDFSKIDSIDKLLIALKKSKDFYFNYYHDYMSLDVLRFNINDLEIPFVDICSYLKVMKEILNNNSYFSLIVDCKHDVPVISKSAINSFVASRCNKDISFNVITDIDDWNVYYDLNGNVVQYIHDYDIIKLDSNYDDYMKRIRKN